MSLTVPSDFLARLRRLLSVGGVVVLALGTAACPSDDDDDDDDGTGPSADCIDEIDFDDEDVFFDESDVETIEAGGSESGSISTSDPELEFTGIGVFYYDIYTLASEDGGTFTVEVDPTGDFDPDLQIVTTAGTNVDYVNDGGEGDTETLEFDADADACYVLLVSSGVAEGTGSYTVSVD